MFTRGVAAGIRGLFRIELWGTGEGVFKDLEKTVRIVRLIWAPPSLPLHLSDLYD
jgi:hypothetical protein